MQPASVHAAEYEEVTRWRIGDCSGILKQPIDVIGHLASLDVDCLAHLRPDGLLGDRDLLAVRAECKASADVNGNDRFHGGLIARSLEFFLQG